MKKKFVYQVGNNKKDKQCMLSRSRDDGSVEI